MKELWEDGSLPRILLLGILLALLGFTPLSKTVTAGFDGVRRAQEIAQLDLRAANLAVLAAEQPWRTGLWTAAGDAALAAGDLQNAGVYYQRAAAKGELPLAHYLVWGDTAWQTDHAQAALQIWEIAKRQGIAPDAVLARQTAAYRTLGDDLALIETLQTRLAQPSLALNPAETAALYLELGHLLAVHDPAAAPAALTQAAVLDPALAPQTADLKRAIQHALLQNDPVYTFVLAGRALAQLGDWAAAEQAFENAVAQHPAYAEAWAYLGEAHQHTDTGDDPLAALETALALDPQSIAANTFRALYAQRRGEYELALDYLETAARLDPDNPAYLVEMGKLVAGLGDLQAGQDYHRQALARAADDPQYLRAFINFSMQFNFNLRTDALPVARQLVMRNPKDPDSLVLMGELLLRLGDTLNAERFFARAAAQDSGLDGAGAEE